MTPSALVLSRWLGGRGEKIIPSSFIRTNTNYGVTTFSETSSPFLTLTTAGSKGLGRPGQTWKHKSQQVPSVVHALQLLWSKGSCESHDILLATRNSVGFGGTVVSEWKLRFPFWKTGTQQMSDQSKERRSSLVWWWLNTAKPYVTFRRKTFCFQWLLQPNMPKI